MEIEMQDSVVAETRVKVVRNRMKK